MNKSDTRPGILRSVAPPAALARHVSAFVHRSETVDGSVIRLLPELRASVQLRRADPYWVRERNDGAAWRRCPRLSLWLPRTAWGYGFVRQDVEVYAFGLTPAGLRAALRGRERPAANAILNLARHPVLGDLAAADAAIGFEDWIERVSDRLASGFGDDAPTRDIGDEAIGHLATDGAGAVAAAAASMGLSVRQFRRRFVASYGVAPKHYQRLLRVDRMLRQLHPRPWETDAFGDAPVPFADQPHAIREFKRTTGVTPAAYRAHKRVGDRTLRSLPAGDHVEPPEAPIAR